jgi:D-alanyl-D-alanine carboxypeptidase
MPILVHTNKDDLSHFTYALRAPTIQSASYLVADLDTHFALVGGNTTNKGNSFIPTTLLTALVSTEYLNIERSFVANQALKDELTELGIAPTASYRVYDLLFPLLVHGSPAARLTLSSQFGSRMFELLKGKASAIGMNDTTFTKQAYGSYESETTVEDLFVLLDYIHTNRTFILTYTAEDVDTRIYGRTALSTLPSNHPLKSEEGFAGGIVAYAPKRLATSNGTEAAIALQFASSTLEQSQYSSDMVTVMELTFGGRKRAIAFIVLDSPNPAQDTRVLIEYTKTLFY